MGTFSNTINYGIFEPTIIAKLIQIAGADLIRQVLLGNCFTQNLSNYFAFKCNQACEAVARIFHAEIVLSVLEFMERNAIDLVMLYVNYNSISENEAFSN